MSVINGFLPVLAPRWQRPREGDLVLFLVTSILMILALATFAVPPALGLGLMAWAWMTFCLSNRDVSEITGRLLHVSRQYQEAEKELSKTRLECDVIATQLAESRQRCLRINTDSPVRPLSAIIAKIRFRRSVLLAEKVRGNPFRRTPSTLKFQRANHFPEKSYFLELENRR